MLRTNNMIAFIDIGKDPFGPGMLSPLEKEKYRKRIEENTKIDD